ncbi:LON peptidase substrate-binding domain-containing protein [Pseudoalteromonas fenneropenaei]|uniref:LON peptidase substrate-binding domain-containing protein n=1 Tax=Pseudoalteromonas fenneropenaei TaxID=1737459 RepID=A0ABV7CMK4_9GAMM
MISAVFPLPLLVLPGGVTRLRIFEPRYLSMVKQVMKNQLGFVLCQYAEERAHQVPEFAGYVKIIDFNQDKAGQLLIDVYCEHWVQIEEVWVDSENVRHGRIKRANDALWPETSQAHDNDSTAAQLEQLSLALQQVFAANPELANLYPQPQFNDSRWLISRWLELVPLSANQKSALLSLPYFEQVVDFLHTLFKSG